MSEQPVMQSMQCRLGMKDGTHAANDSKELKNVRHKPSCRSKSQDGERLVAAVLGGAGLFEGLERTCLQDEL